MDKEKVELGRLATPESDEEDEGEEEEKGRGVKYRDLEKNMDVEEEEEEEVKNEEKVSLLDERVGCPLTSIVTSSKATEVPRVSSAVVVLPNPQQGALLTQARLATPDPDIQLAEVEPTLHRIRRPPTSGLAPLSSLHTVCGPRPARITAACLLVLSLWAAFMLLIHMNKKIDNLNDSLESTNDKLKTIEEAREEYRVLSMKRLARMGKLIQSLRDPGLEDKSATDSVSRLPIGPVVPSTPLTHTATPTTQGSFFGKEWFSNTW